MEATQVTRASQRCPGVRVTAGSLCFSVLAERPRRARFGGPSKSAHRDKLREWGRLKAKGEPLLTSGNSGDLRRSSAFGGSVPVNPYAAITPVDSSEASLLLIVGIRGLPHGSGVIVKSLTSLCTERGIYPKPRTREKGTLSHV